MGIGRACEGDQAASARRGKPLRQAYVIFYT